MLGGDSLGLGLGGEDLSLSAPAGARSREASSWSSGLDLTLRDRYGNGRFQQPLETQPRMSACRVNGR